jgi:uncharacterized phiE125 gp8 family phage protein
MTQSIPDAIVVVTPPAEECVTVAEVKLQTRVDTAEEDDLILSYIKSARAQFETMTHGRVILSTTFRETHQRWNDLFGYHPRYYYNYGKSLAIKLHRAPVTSVTSIQYRDIDDVLQTLSASSYIVDTDGKCALINFKAGVGYPALSPNYPRPIRITYVAGNETVEEVPEDIKDAVRSLAALKYWQRESHTDGSLSPVPNGFDAVCVQHDTGLWGF